MNEHIQPKNARPVAEGVVLRERLFSLLDGRSQSVVWVASPAGSGKTTLAASYLEARSCASLWYTLKGSDSDPASFFHNLTEALSCTATSDGKLMPVLTPEYMGGIEVFSRHYFLELFSRLNDSTVLVFDNFQDVGVQSPTTAVIQSGLSVIPPGFRSIVISREEPPFIFSDMTANRMLGVIGWEELKMDLDESRRLVMSMGCQLDETDLVRIHSKTDGWAAGLVILSESVKVKELDFETLYNMPPDEIFGYFSGEILDRIPSQEREFLLKTSVFPELTPDAANKLTGVNDSANRLFALERRHYFTERVAGPSPNYRYHPLFREFLQDRARTELGVMFADTQKAAAGLLEHDGRMEEAVGLYIEAGDWPSAGRVVLGLAPSYLAQGRNMTLLDWLGRFPDDVMNTTPWLSFWKGIGMFPVNPNGARDILKSAHQGFWDTGDSSGVYLSWSGMVDTYLQEADNLSELDGLIDLFHEIKAKFPDYPSPIVEERVTVSMFTAMGCRRTGSPETVTWMEKARPLLSKSADMQTRLTLMFFLTVYNGWKGDSRFNDAILKNFMDENISENVPPMVLISFKVTKAAHCWITARYDEGTALVDEVLDLAQKNGVHVWDLYALEVAAGIMAEIGDIGAMDSYLDKLAANLGRARNMDVAYFHILSIWNAMLKGDPARAAGHLDELELSVRRLGFEFHNALLLILRAQHFSMLGEKDKVFPLLDEASRIASGMNSHLLKVTYNILCAFYLFADGKDNEGIEKLSSGFKTAREHGIVHFIIADPAVIAEACTRAIEEDIEPEYAMHIMKMRMIESARPPIYVEKWPRPLKIRTMGGFEIERDGVPIQSSGKVQHKPLLLLKALIALGGSDVEEAYLSDLIWPDSEGDAAHKAFTTTLARLRQLLEVDKAIALQEHKLSLDTGLVWVDAWAFNHYADVSLAAFGHDTLADSAIRSAERAIGLYQGGFLSQDKAYEWAMLPRERYRDKYLRLVLRFGKHMFNCGGMERAVDLYYKGLEADNLIEDFYRGLMECFRALGRRTEAVSVYRRCVSTLKASLDIEPSRQTEALYRAILSEN